VAGGDAEQGAERGVPGTAAVEAEDKLVEIGLQMPRRVFYITRS
jgi:hypothetical protein